MWEFCLLQCLGEGANKLVVVPSGGANKVVQTGCLRGGLGVEVNYIL